MAEKKVIVVTRKMCGDNAVVVRGDVSTRAGIREVAETVRALTDRPGS